MYMQLLILQLELTMFYVAQKAALCLFVGSTS